MIENLLRNYRDNISKIKLIDLRWARLEIEYKEMKEEISELSASRITDEGKAKNKISSATENCVTAMESAEERRAAILREMEELSERKFYIQCDIDEADAYLERLPMEERYILKWFYIEGLCWSLIVEQYKKEFGQYRSINALKRKRDTGMNIINAS